MHSITSIIFLVQLAVILSGFEQAAATTSFQVQPFIVNGSIAADSDFNFAASIQTLHIPVSSCTGSVVSSQYVLTAAHCHSEKEPITAVVVGMHDLTDPKPLNTFNVSKVVVHPKYTMENDVGMGYDIAILKLEKPIALPNVKPIVLARSKELEVTGEIATIAGWGLTQHGNSSSASKKLLFGKNELLSWKDCDAQLKKALSKLTDEELKAMNLLTFKYVSIFETSVCAKITKGVDTSQGDSGGPLFRQIDGQDVLVGATSWGIPSTSMGLPSIYVSVANFYNFIEENSKGHTWTKETATQPPKSSSTKAIGNVWVLSMLLLTGLLSAL